MPEQSLAAAAVWSDPEFARGWLNADPQGAQDLLALPRRMAAALIAEELPKPALVVDIASGAGKFLAVMLDAFPEARGVWMDASETMREQAQQELARFGARVEYRLGDMGALREAGVPEGADVISTSRASHHLGREELHGFYRETAGLLAPQGWLVNLDHIGPTDAWNRRYRSARKHFTAPRAATPGHHHNYPLASTEDHLDGFRSAGLEDVDVAWKAFHTCLILGRCPLAQS